MSCIQAGTWFTSALRERGQGDVGEWGRRLISPLFSLSLLSSPSPPMMLFRKCTMVDTCVLSERTLLLFMCSAEGRKKARGAVKQAKAMLPLSVSFFYFPLFFLSLPPIFYLNFIACVHIQAKGEACMKPSVCFFVISLVWTYFWNTKAVQACGGHK